MKEVALKATYNAMLRGLRPEEDAMKDLTFGDADRGVRGNVRPWLFWAMVAAAVVVTLLYLYVLIRDRAMSAGASSCWRSWRCRWARWRRCCSCRPITDSHLRDIGGPVDVIAGGVLGAQAQRIDWIKDFTKVKDTTFQGARCRSSGSRTAR
jgi:hypothetical protein